MKGYSLINVWESQNILLAHYKKGYLSLIGQECIEPFNKLIN